MTLQRAVTSAAAMRDSSRARLSCPHLEIWLRGQKKMNLWDPSECAWKILPSTPLVRQPTWLDSAKKMVFHHENAGSPVGALPWGNARQGEPCDRWREASYGGTPLLPRLGAVDTREWRPPPRTSKISTKTELKMTPGGSPAAAGV